jgi:DNA invertase Pin-like site-specific DNA recombinase
LSNIAGMHIGYARLAPQVSSTVLAKLEAAGCEQVVIERGSTHGRSLERALRRLGEGDVLVVPALDSLASTLPALLSRLHAIAARGASLRSLADAMDVRSDTGSQLVAALMAFERSRVSARIRGGMRSAKRSGQHVGRPRLLDAQQVRAALARVDAGEPVPHVARALGVSRQTLQRAFRGTEVSGQRIQP